MTFTRACRQMNLPQWIFLPQHRDAYFEATAENGEPDFSNHEKSEALSLLDSPHIVQDRIASDTPNRQLRFKETNIELVRHSDFLLCMVRECSDPKPGGTQDVINQAIKWGKPVLLVTIGTDGQQVRFREEWLGEPVEIAAASFLQPVLPSEIATLDVSALKPPAYSLTARMCLQTVMGFCEEQARKQSRLFKSAALIIVGTHCLATVCAVIALNAFFQSLLLTFLGIEIALLLTGYLVHHHLHHRASASRWAFHRLMAEISRSVLALKGCHIALQYLHALPFPDILRPYLRTIDILNLRDSRSVQSDRWQEFRDQYLTERLEGQLGFYQREAARATKLQRLAQRFFVLFSLSAIIATSCKVVFVLSHIPIFWIDASNWKTFLGCLAVVLPVGAVAALSLAAANDLEARQHSFKETHDFLILQQRRLACAASEREFTRLVMDTESRLLGETVNWFSRRSFTWVA